MRELVFGETTTAGSSLVRWDGRDMDTNLAGDGLYLVVVDALGQTQSKTIVVVRQTVKVRRARTLAFMAVRKIVWRRTWGSALLILVSVAAFHGAVRGCSASVPSEDTPAVEGMESSGASPESFVNQAVSLPGGLDPIDVMRGVNRYRASAPALKEERDVGAMRGERADEVGMPFPIGVGGPAPGPVEFDQLYPSVAFGAANYLVVWEDRRNNDNGIFGARVSMDGKVLDPGGIWIAEGFTSARAPAVAFDGTDYLVVWQDSRNGYRNGYNDVYGARVTTEGVVVDSLGIPISTKTASQTSPSVSCDGPECLVVWQDSRTRPADIYGARVNSAGAVLDTNGIAVSVAAGQQGYPRIAFSGTGYLVAWTDDRNGNNDIYGARVNRDGVVLDTAGVAISTVVESQVYPAVACDGTGCLVVWGDRRSRSVGIGDSTDIYGARVSSSGTVLDTSGIPISLAASGQFLVSAAFDGTNYLVVWGDSRVDSRDIYCSRVSTEGAVLDTAGVAVCSASTWQVQPVVAFDGTNYLVTWYDYRNGQWDIYGARLTTAPAVLDAAGIAVSVIGTDQYDVAVGFDGTNYLVLWSDESHGLWDIYGARVAVDGAVLDPDGLAISTAPGIQLAPTVAFNGANYLVVWEDWRNGSRDIYGARVGIDGAVLDTAGIVISAAADDQRAPAIAFDRTGYPNCLVAWEDWRNGSWDIYGNRVGPDGAVLDSAGIVISAAQGDQRTPAVAFSGANYLVVWEDGRSGSWDIGGTLLSRAGVVIGSGSIPISTSNNYQLSPDVAFDGANYFVVWADERNGGPFDIYGTRVGVTGAVLDQSGRVISVAPNHQMFPAVLFDGTNYLVVWEDGRNGLSDIYGARVGLNGAVLDPYGLVMASSPGNQFSGAVANGPVCSALVAYSSYTQPMYRSYRVWGSVWSGPTAILFTSANADGEGGRVSLAWEVAEDLPSPDFRIERADSRDGRYVTRRIQVKRDSAHSFSCVDVEVEVGRTYWYMIVLESAATEERCGPLGVEVGPAVSVWSLQQSQPNPFNPHCMIRFDVKEAGLARMRVLDVAGRVARTLVDGWREPGAHRIVWDGTDDRGKELASGVYFCVLEAGRFRAVRKIVISR